MISALEALDRLRRGNARFAANERTHASVSAARARRAELAAGQAPFAIVLGCSDSRTPPEFIFDQDLGDLFVVRVAGNIVAPCLAASVEFAVSQFGARLVVVLGHTRCGAVHATFRELEQPDGERSPHLAHIVDHLRPAIEGLLDKDSHGPSDALVAQAVRANALHAANRLRHDSEVLEPLIRNDGLLVVAAEYSLESGRVDFFDGAPDDARKRSK